jgi:hypothetical protein
MKSSRLLFVLLLLTSACSVSSGQNGLDTQFRPPIVYQQWSTKNYALKDGRQVCALSSGYNGIIISLGAAQDDVVVASTRLMQPGAILSVNANGQHFEASDTYFPRNTGPAMVAAFAQGGKAYLEWSEFSGSSARERSRVQNIIKLDDFPARLQECRKSLGQ